MSQRPSRTPVANLALAAVLTLCLLPVSVPAQAGAAGSRLQPRAAESRLLDRLERLRAALWQDVISLWGKAGARIDDNGKS